MKPLTFNFYHIDDDEKPELLDDIIIVGDREWDVISFDGSFLPAWVEYWCKLDFSEL